MGEELNSTRLDCVGFFLPDLRVRGQQAALAVNERVAHLLSPVIDHLRAVLKNDADLWRRLGEREGEVSDSTTDIDHGSALRQLAEGEACVQRSVSRQVRGETRTRRKRRTGKLVRRRPKRPRSDHSSTEAREKVLVAGTRQVLPDWLAQTTTDDDSAVGGGGGVGGLGVEEDFGEEGGAFEDVVGALDESWSVDEEESRVRRGGRGMVAKKRAYQ